MNFGKLRAGIESRPRVEFGRVVEVDTGVLRADIDITKCRLQGARRIDRMRARSREHPPDGAAA